MEEVLEKFSRFPTLRFHSNGCSGVKMKTLETVSCQTVFIRRNFFIIIIIYQSCRQTDFDNQPSNRIQFVLFLCWTPKICNLRACLTPKLKEGFNTFKYRLHTISRLRTSVPSHLVGPETCEQLCRKVLTGRFLSRCQPDAGLTGQIWLSLTQSCLPVPPLDVWISAQTKVLRGPVMLSCV